MTSRFIAEVGEGRVVKGEGVETGRKTEGVRERWSPNDFLILSSDEANPRRS